MKAQIVSFRCVLRNKFGKIISSTYNQEVITCGPAKGLLSGLADGLRDLKKGETRKITLSASEAYGFYDPALLLEWSHEDFPEETPPPRPGQRLAIQNPAGQTKYYRVLEVHADRVTLDANHPLAGQDLIFEIEATEVRDATPEEINGASSDPKQQTFH